MKENYKYSTLEEKILRLQVQKQIINYISKHDEPYFESIVKNSIFIYHYFFYSRKLFLIDLCRLLNHKENDSFPRFIKELRKSIMENPSNFELTESEINFQNKRVKNIINSKLFKNITAMRNKHLVHDDIDKDSIDQTINFDEVFEILDQIFDIYNKTFGEIHKRTLSAEVFIQFFELESLHKYEKLSSFILQNNDELNHSIKTTDLLKIMRN